jgi:hypothetical protein
MVLGRLMVIKVGTKKLAIKTMKRKTIINLFFFIIFLSGCNSIDTEYIKSNLWQYEDGFKIGQGDFVDFKKLDFYKLKGDTIYLKNKPCAIVFKLDKKLNEMWIRSIESKKTGIYINTDEFRK